MNPLDLIDHPPADAEPARNGAFSAQVMERVRQAAHRPSPAAPARWPWAVAAVVAALLSCPLPDWELDADLAPDPLLAAELLAISLVAGIVLLATRRSA